MCFSRHPLKRRIVSEKYDVLHSRLYAIEYVELLSLLCFILILLSVVSPYLLTCTHSMAKSEVEAIQQPQYSHRRIWRKKPTIIAHGFSISPPWAHISPHPGTFPLVSQTQIRIPIPVALLSESFLPAYNAFSTFSATVEVLTSGNP